MEKEGVATGVAGGRRRRCWNPGETGWGVAGCASVRRSVCQSVRATRALVSLPCSARPRQGLGLAPPLLPPPASLAPSQALRWVLSPAPPGPAWGRPSLPAGPPLPLPARAVPASACARALSLAPARSSPIYEARSHHVLMSLCPALAAAAAAPTPPRELRGEGPARRAARRRRLQTLLALGTRLGAGPGARGDELLRFASSTSLPHRPPPRLRSRHPHPHPPQQP